VAEVEYMHICDHAFRTDSGKACIIGIFTYIWAPSFPAKHPQMVIAIQFQGKPHEVFVPKIEIGRPNGDVLGRIEGDSLTCDPEGGAFLVATMVGTPFPEPGRYTVKVLAAGRPLATQSFQVHKMAQPPAGQQTRH
jgi:hypothetical protein